MTYYLGLTSHGTFPVGCRAELLFSDSPEDAAASSMGYVQEIGYEDDPLGNNG